MTRRQNDIDTKDTVSAYENMPGRCFIGDRSLQNFNEYSYCHESKFYIIINEIPQCNYKYIATINKINSYTGIKSDIEAPPEPLRYSKPSAVCGLIQVV